MEIVRVTAGPLKEQMEQLLYEEMWKPYGIGRDARQQLGMAGEELAFVCMDGEEAVGAMVMFVNGNLADLRLAAVASRRRREGIGQRLWAYILHDLASRPEVVSVELHSRNTALQFWSSLGFVEEESEWLTHRLYEPHGIRFKRMTYDVRAGQC